MCRVASFALALSLYLFAALHSALPALAEDTRPDMVPVPDWVDHLPDITTLSGLGSGEDHGLRHLLHDVQFAWPDGQRQIWERQVIEITTPEGAVEAGVQIFSYYTTNEDFALTGVSLWRDGEERLLAGTPQLVMESFNASEDPAQGDQQRFVLLNVFDLRPGDVLDFSSLRRSVSGLPELEREAVAQLGFEGRVTLARAVVNWPEGWALSYPPLPESVTRISGPLPDGGTRHEFQSFDAPPVVPVELVPAWVDEFTMLRLNAGRDWGHIVTALAPHYTADWPLGSWEARLDALRPAAGAALSTREIAAALRMVQGEISDSGAPFVAGQGMMTPPALVVEKSAGAPSEKALLLRTLLRRLGFEADVALSGYDYGRALDRLPPSMAFLDKPLVRVRLEGRVWWLDPSAMPQEARLEASSPPDFGFALPLTAGTLVPEAMDTDPAAIWTSDVKESWRITPAGLFLDVVSEHRGESADDLRYRHAEYGIRDISSELHSYYQIVFPNMVMIREPDFSDDPLNNVVLLHERYFLPSAALREEGLLVGFPVAAEDFAADLPQGGAAQLKAVPRKFPMIGLSPGHYRHRAEVTGRFGLLQPPQAVTLDNPAFRYALQGSVPGPGRLVVEWDFLARATDIALADLPQVLDDAQIVNETTWFTYDLD